MNQEGGKLWSFYTFHSSDLLIIYYVPDTLLSARNITAKSLSSSWYPHIRGRGGQTQCARTRTRLWPPRNFTEIGQPSYWTKKQAQQKPWKRGGGFRIWNCYKISKMSSLKQEVTRHSNKQERMTQTYTARESRRHKPSFRKKARMSDLADETSE